MNDDYSRYERGPHSNRRSWQGRWSDGQTAAAHPVEIELQRTALLFRPEDSPTPKIHQWPYNAIQSPHPVSSSDDHVLLTASAHPGERLYIDEPDFAREILERAPNISRRSHQWALLKWPLGMAAALVLFWALTWFDIISPANSLAHLMPDKARITIGQGIIKTIRQDRKICHTAAADAALNKMIARLSPALPKDLNFRIEVADINYVNAFAAPGDRIIVSGKLIQQAKSPDEVAGVIAHELGHSIERHPEANLIRALGILTMLQLLTAGEAGAFGDLAFMLVQSGYSRSAESEADVHADKILSAVNVDSRPLAGFFERIISLRKTKKSEDDGDTAENGAETKPANKPADQTMTRHPGDDEEESDYESGLTSWISTHPPTKKRIEFFRNSKRETTPEILTHTEWRALKAICGKPKPKKKGGSSKADET